MATKRQIIPIPLLQNGGINSDESPLGSSGAVEVRGVVYQGGISNTPKIKDYNLQGVRGATYFKGNNYLLNRKGEIIMADANNLNNTGSGNGSITITTDTLIEYIPVGSPTFLPSGDANTFESAVPVNGWLLRSEVDPYPLLKPFYWDMEDLPWWAVEANGSTLERGVSLPADWFDILVDVLTRRKKFVSKSDYDSGLKGRFVKLDNTHLMVPNLVGKVIRSLDASGSIDHENNRKVGSFQEAGVPNLKGRIGGDSSTEGGKVGTNQRYGNSGEGAISSQMVEKWGSLSASAGLGADQGIYEHTLDASRVSPTYKENMKNDVAMPNIAYPYIIRVYPYEFFTTLTPITPR